MRFDDKIQLKTFYEDTNENCEPIEVEEWIDLGKCTIFPNNAAQQQKAEDSTPRVYQYEIVMRKPKVAIPKEGDWVHITKKDGSVDEEIQVRGFVTLGGRFLKLWV